VAIRTKKSCQGARSSAEDTRYAARNLAVAARSTPPVASSATR
jgi:hypothetical protein